MHSLSARLLVAVSILLLIALTLTAVILDRLFRNAAIDATAERLNTQLVLLMSSADINSEGLLEMPELIPEARFMTPDSGLLGFVNDKSGMLWKSDSAVGVTIPDLDVTSVRQNSLERMTYAGAEYFQTSLSVEWEVDVDTYQTFLFTTAESLAPFNAQLNEFRTRLFSWFAFLIVCLLAAQAFLMRWVLKPLRRIASEVSEIDRGTRDKLTDNYPSELLGVTTNTNTLIQAERSRLARYKNTLGNLAHSLKTPLAVIQTATEQSQTDKQLIQTQVKTMNDIVTYQLKRAATVGQVSLGREPVKIKEVINKITEALEKVYFDKQLTFINDCQDNLVFYGDHGDLTEVIGNLLDNAAKWARQTVKITASELAQINKRSGICLIIDDDGKGIIDAEKERILQRGQRADENTPGYGIGLSMVKEIALSYHGSLEIEQSPIGGARFIVRLPAF